jgi:glucose/arabinose dehydrogenase
MRVRTSGGAPELVAWGFRYPFGLGFSPDGVLYATDNGYDERGSRPVFGTGDIFWRVQRGAWHGWPDYSAGRPLDDVKPLIANPPNQPPRPAAILGVHSSANGFDFSRSDRFGHRGEAFIALFGDQAPGVGKTLHPVGFKVVRVDPKTGVVEDFAINKGRKTMPASKQRSGGLERPVAVRFDPGGSALYVVDFGVLTMSHQGATPHQNTGVLWRITRG